MKRKNVIIWISYGVLAGLSVLVVCWGLAVKNLMPMVIHQASQAALFEGRLTDEDLRDLYKAADWGLNGLLTPAALVFLGWLSLSTVLLLRRKSTTAESTPPCN